MGDDAVEAKCKSCGNTGTDFMGKTCTCSYGQALATDQVKLDAAASSEPAPQGEEKKKKKGGGAKFAEGDDLQQVEKYEMAKEPDPDKRASQKKEKILVLGSQKLQRSGTSNALSLVAVVDPQDADVKAAGCPKVGRANLEIVGVEKVPAVDKVVQMDVVISSGGYSSFQRGFIADNASSLAVKCVSASALSESCKNDMFEVEIKMVNRMNHPNVIRALRVIQDSSMLCLMYDDCTGGDLFDRLASKLPATAGLRYVSHMVAGLAYCHGLNICHRDVRPENFLLSNQTPQAVLKLVDFSLASFNKDNTPMHTMVGCPTYAAPEVTAGSYCMKLDVWSVGVVAFLCCCGQLPIYDPSGSAKTQIQKVVDAEIDWGLAAKIDKRMLAALQEMLVKDVSKRAAMERIAGYTWLKDAGVAANGCCSVM